MSDLNETTQSRKLTDIAADHMARVWYELQYPQEYRSTRYVNGHAVTVTVTNSGYHRIEDVLETMTAEEAQEK